jgi:tripartite-type tricarboxylate transporter receptor subunit TctC
MDDHRLQFARADALECIRMPVRVGGIDFGELEKTVQDGRRICDTPIAARRSFGSYYSRRRRNLMHNKLFRFVRGAVAAAVLVAPVVALAQAYPVKPVRIVIPYPPGGVDVTIRLLTNTMDAELGQPTVFDYRSGASGIIGTEHVARADPDGYTVLATASNPWVVSPAMKKTIGYHPIRDFTPISMVIEGVNLIVATPSFPANNVRELIEYARKNPSKVSWSTTGIGSSWHLEIEHIQHRADVKILHVPFQGFAQMIPPLLTGEVPMALITYQIINKLVAAGKVKMIGVLSTNPKTRHLFPPGVQQVSEVLPGYQSAPSWIAFGGPAKMARPVVMRLNGAIVKAINQPSVQERFTADKIVATGSTPEELGERIRSDFELAQRVVREAKIPLED